MPQPWHSFSNYKQFRMENHALGEVEDNICVHYSKESTGQNLTVPDSRLVLIGAVSATTLPADPETPTGWIG